MRRSLHRNSQRSPNTSISRQASRCRSPKHSESRRKCPVCSFPILPSAMVMETPVKGLPVLLGREQSPKIAHDVEMGKNAHFAEVNEMIEIGEKGQKTQKPTRQWQ